VLGELAVGGLVKETVQRLIGTQMASQQNVARVPV